MNTEKEAQKTMKTLCVGCEKPRAERGWFPHCKACHTELHSRLAQDNHLSGDEVGSPRCTDTGNGLRFASMHYHDVLYVPEAGCWFTWNGKVWEKDSEGIRVMHLAKIVTQRMFVRAAGIKDNADLRDAQLAWAKQTESVTRLQAMVTSARTTCRVARYTDFDQDPWLFNAANATVDLKTGQARPHSRRDLMTKASSVAYNSEALCERWLQFLREIMPGHESCCIPFLQRAVGYSLTGRTDEECFFVAWGKGRNGKTKLLETLQYIMGEYAKTASFDTFVVKNGNDKLNDIAGFKGARMVCASESEHSKRLAESKIKQMTGGDMVVGEFKYEEQFNYVPSYKIWLRTNYKPRVVGTDDGIWDRTRLIAFTEYFGDDRKDPQLGDKLRGEASGILNWMIAGAQAWAENGLGTPACVKDATSEYRKAQNVLGQFLEDRCLVSSGSWVGQTALYRAYKFWAEESGEYVMTKTEFTERMEMQFGDPKRSGPRGRYWQGVALKSEYQQLDDEETVEAITETIQ
jgi:putative DNA primase/helicase